jgi:hypothetical protein
MPFVVWRLRTEQAALLGYNVTSLCCGYLCCDTVQSCKWVIKSSDGSDAITFDDEDCSP